MRKLRHRRPWNFLAAIMDPFFSSVLIHSLFYAAVDLVSSIKRIYALHKTRDHFDIWVWEISSGHTTSTLSLSYRREASVL